MISWALVGVVTGLTLGLTGAGGAIIAVPLFVHLVGTSLAEATTLSLVAVISGAALSWTVQRKATNASVAVLLFPFSTVGSVLLRPVKLQSPDWVITTLFSTVAVLSLMTMWFKRSPTQAERNLQIDDKFTLVTLLKFGVGGTVLGGLVTMTGLGGGAIVMPFLRGVLSMPLHRAAATSLLTILLSAIFSLTIQARAVSELLELSEVAALIGGSIAAALLTRAVVRGTSFERMDQIRQSLVTVVVLFSVITLFARN